MYIVGNKVIEGRITAKCYIIQKTLHLARFFMRMVGLEPTRGHPRKILSLVRLPFRHIRKCEVVSFTTLSILPFFISFVNIFVKKPTSVKKCNKESYSNVRYIIKISKNIAVLSI